MRASRTLEVKLDDPLPDVMPGPDDSDVVRLDVTRNGMIVGTVTIVTGGHPISRARASDEIVAAIGRRRLDPADRFGHALRVSQGLQ